MVYIVLKESYNKEAGVGSTIEMGIVNTITLGDDST